MLVMKPLLKTTALFYFVILGVSVTSYGQTPPKIDPRHYINPERAAPPNVRALLAKLRREKVAKKWTFNPSYTKALDKSLGKITGAIIPPNFRQHVIDQNKRAKILLGQLKVGAPVRRLPQCVGQRHFDWRDQAVSTAVKDQGDCGTCWDFAACSAFEECWKFVNDEVINVSEQNILDCNSGGKDCDGGWPSDALDYIQSIGVASEADDPYVGRRITPCNQSLSKPYKAQAWGYVGDDDGIPSVEQIKTYLCSYGPLVIGIRATEAFQSFASNPGEVFNEDASGDVNHVVTLIGWDDNSQAWLIKNSWGDGGWGQAGYGWVSCFTNKVGYGAAWVLPHAVPTENGKNPLPSPIIHRIHPPIVDRKDVIYDGHNASPVIKFKPGDKLQIDVGGCVQTGGEGNTWKRYVKPSGPDSDRFYFGMILRPGENNLVPFRDIVTDQKDPTHPDQWSFNYTVPNTITDQQSYLHVGYSDDHYEDNGYEDHDDGTEDQCRNVGPAYIIITITR
jgi:cathepsin L